MVVVERQKSASVVHQNFWCHSDDNDDNTMATMMMMMMQ
jgi:hypothetical protein